MTLDAGFEIPVYVDGAKRGTIRWHGSAAGVAPDDIRLARKLKEIAPLWSELVESRVVRVAFDGEQLSLTTKAGGKVFSAEFFVIREADSGQAEVRPMDNSHPFLEICDFPGAPQR